MDSGVGETRLGAEVRLKNKPTGTALVAQWLRIRLPVQGTWVRALLQEDSHMPRSN